MYINLYQSLKDRKYELSILRTVGASRFKLFGILILEGLIVNLIGSIIGILWGHLFVEIIGITQEARQLKLTGFLFLKQEFNVVFGSILLGLICCNCTCNKRL